VRTWFSPATEIIISKCPFPIIPNKWKVKIIYAIFTSFDSQKPKVSNVFAEYRKVRKNFILKFCKSEKPIAQRELTLPSARSARKTCTKKSKKQKFKTFKWGRIPKYNSNMEV
jgi:hypothetical protein